jgi:hypothetical protein
MRHCESGASVVMLLAVKTFMVRLLLVRRPCRSVVPSHWTGLEKLELTVVMESRLAGASIVVMAG